MATHAQFSLRIQAIAVICFAFLGGTMIVAEQALSPFSLQWQQSDSFPEPRSGYSGDVLDGRLVIAGGTYWDGTAGR